MINQIEKIFPDGWEWRSNELSEIIPGAKTRICFRLKNDLIIPKFKASMLLHILTYV